MIVVVPLGAKFSRRRAGTRVEQLRRVVVVLQHEMDVTAALRRERADRTAHVRQHARLAVLGDRVHGIEPQPVEAIAVEPMQRVLDREGAHLRDAVVDRLAPRGGGGRKEAGRGAAEVVSFRAEVVVDHVEKHHEAALVRGVDQRAQVVGPAVGAVGCVEQHAVVAPVAPAGEIGDRHQLDRGEARHHHVVELVDRGAKRAFGRERPDVQLENDRLFPWAPAPVGHAPAICAMIDHLARARDIVGLERRGRVGHVELAVDAEAIARAGDRVGDREPVPPVGLRLHGSRTVDDELHRPGGRRPQPKRHALRRQFRAEAKAAHAPPRTPGPSTAAPWRRWRRGGSRARPWGPRC